jgi:phage gpG-like protein
VIPKMKIRYETRALARRLAGAGDKMDRGVKTEVAQTAATVQADAKGRAAVRTGRLRDSIHTLFQNGGRNATVGTDVPYARFQKKKFLQPAWRREKPKFLQRMHDRVTEAIR